jgi:hypothetical protein
VSTVGSEQHRSGGEDPGPIRIPARTVGTG